MNLSQLSPLAWTVYDNPLSAWLVALGILTVGSALLLLVKHVVVARLERYSRRTRTDLDDLVADVLKGTRAYFIVMVVLSGAALALVLPPGVRQGIRALTVIALCFQVIRWGNRVISFWVGRYTTRHADGTVDGATATTVTAVGYAARLLLWLVILLLALDNFGVNVTALVAGLGITGIAVALAVQSVLGDLMAALSIVLDKPFVVGDVIVVDQFQGTVENIGLRSTRVRSLTGEQIIFSNADLLRSRILNYRRMVERRVTFVLGVTYDTPPDTVARIPALLGEIVTAQEFARLDRTHFRGFADSALEFETVYFMLTDDYTQYMDAQQAINLAILRRFQADGIDFAYPTRTLIMHEGEAGDPQSDRTRVAMPPPPSA